MSARRNIQKRRCRRRREEMRYRFGPWRVTIEVGPTYTTLELID